jgi:hypothetical protein
MTRLDHLMYQAGLTAQGSWDQMDLYDQQAIMKFAQLLIKDVLDEVAERAYYSGDRAWSDQVDRPWIEMEYGIGTLADAQRKAGIIK